MGADTFKLLSARVPAEFMEPADELIRRVDTSSSEFKLLGNIRRADVLRVTLERGLTSLEKKDPP